MKKKKNIKNLIIDYCTCLSIISWQEVNMRLTWLFQTSSVQLGHNIRTESRHFYYCTQDRRVVFTCTRKIWYSFITKLLYLRHIFLCFHLYGFLTLGKGQDVLLEGMLVCRQGHIFTKSLRPHTLHQPGPISQCVLYKLNI